MGKANAKFISAKKFAQLLIDIHKYSVQVCKDYRGRTLIELRSYAVEINQSTDENCFIRVYQRQGHLNLLAPIMIITNMVIKQPYRKTITLKSDSSFELGDFTEERLFQNSLVMTRDEEFMQYLSFWLYELNCKITFHTKTIQYQTMHGLHKALKDIVEDQNKWKLTA